MREKEKHLYVDSHESTILLHSLVELKNQLIQQGGYTDCIDELIFKMASAPVKKLKVLSHSHIKNTPLILNERVSGFFMLIFT